MWPDCWSPGRFRFNVRNHLEKFINYWCLSLTPETVIIDLAYSLGTGIFSKLPGDSNMQSRAGNHCSGGLV